MIVLKWPKPRVVISRCIEFEHVRYNGQIISSDFVKGLLPHIDAVPICPEVEIGLGIPRDSLRLVKQGDEIRLLQPATKMDYTEKMNEFTYHFFSNLGEVDGFILRSGSPSSGLTRVKIYASIEKSPAIGRGSGLFAGKVKEKYGHLAIEEDLRLKQSRIREHFLRKLYTLASFREMKKERILIVEDHKDSLDVCISLLSASGYEVKGAQSGIEAIGMCQNCEFDLVLSDYRLGDITGLEVLEKSKDIMPACATVMMTAYATNDLISSAFAAQTVSAFLLKPLNTEKLLSTVRSCLARRSFKRRISEISGMKIRRAVADIENL